MGKYNSSKTRVAPVFDRLLAEDVTGRSWLPLLLSLPMGGVGTADLTDVDVGIVGHWWEGNPKEKPLAPPVSLLRWLVQNLSDPENPAVWRTSEETHLKRRALVDGNPDTIREALELLDKAPAKKVWYVLEGESYPDVYLETLDVIVVIEGKRTEGKPTRATSWMPGRRQMWRHLDCAWESRGQKRLYGLMIVETDEEATMFAKGTVSSEAVKESLPHRSTAEVAAITTCFLGATTWQTVCDRCGVPWSDIEALEA